MNFISLKFSTSSYARKTKKDKREGTRAIIASKLSFDAHENGKKNKSAEMRYVKVWCGLMLIIISKYIPGNPNTNPNPNPNQKKRDVRK